jgi:hypothetical protein
MRAHVLLAAVLALTVTGCFEATTSIDVADDGRGTINGTYAVDTSEIPLLGGAACDMVRSQFEGDPNLGIESFESGNNCGIRFATEFTPASVDDALAAAGIGGATLRQNGDCDCWEFRAPIGGLVSQFDPTQFGVDALSADDVDLRFLVRLPGRQVEHNGDEIDGDGFVVWKIDIDDPPAELLLRTEPGDPITGSGAGAGLVLVIVALVIAVLGAAAWYVLRRKPQTGAVATGPPMPTGDWTGAANMPPLDAGAWQPTAPPVTDEAPARPSEADAAGTSVWDPTRNAYISFDPTTRTWLVYDQAAGRWMPG